MEGRISSSGGKQATAQFQLKTLSSEERKKRAFRHLGICWGLMLATLPLPPIHWLTVPGFFFLGIYLWIQKWKASELMESLSFPCPECERAVTLPVREPQNPLVFPCPHCRYTLRLSY